MIGSRPHGKRFDKHRGIQLFMSALLAACLGLPNIGCGMLPGSIGNLPAKIGLRSRDAELRAKVQADKFPTAKEAGL
jgi:hypothetical protein